MILLVTILVAVLVPVPWPWNAWLIVAGCLLEIGEVIVLRRWSKHLGRTIEPATGAEAMIGTTGTVETPCRPVGTVKAAGELWEARCDAGADPGDIVRIDGLDGLVLVVSTTESARPPWQVRGADS